VGEELAREFPDQEIGLYAGRGKSGIWEDGQFLRREREEIKFRIRSGRIKILLGTDAASEGLNLQALGNLINIDLPWNPTRLEQRKGRIQRIGQNHDIINVLNLRYKDSVEDKVHESLSERLRQLNNIFGQVPDVLKDVWVKVALDKMEEAEKLIEDIPKKHPFNERYSKMNSVPEWDTWETVVNRREKIDELKRGW
ncbi:MAG: helicase-related protein, partial [Spirochaetaceae bacterium]